MEYSSDKQICLTTKGKPMASLYQASRPSSSSTKHSPFASTTSDSYYYHLGNLQSSDESIDARATSYISCVQERFRHEIS